MHVRVSLRLALPMLLLPLRLPVWVVANTMMVARRHHLRRHPPLLCYHTLAMVSPHVVLWPYQPTTRPPGPHQLWLPPEHKLSFLRPFLLLPRHRSLLAVAMLRLAFAPSSRPTLLPLLHLHLVECAVTAPLMYRMQRSVSSCVGTSSQTTCAVCRVTVVTLTLSACSYGVFEAFALFQYTRHVTLRLGVLELSASMTQLALCFTPFSAARCLPRRATHSNRAMSTHGIIYFAASSFATRDLEVSRQTQL